MEDIKDLAKKEKAKFIQRCPDWKGKEVWQLMYEDPDEETQKIGIPVLAVKDPNGAKLMDDAEFNEYLKYVSSLPSPEEREEPDVEEIE